MRSMILHLFWAAIAGAMGCDSKSDPGPVAATTPPAAQPAAQVQPIPDIRPEYTLSIAADSSTPPKHTIQWTARVNTGGWTMKTEKVLVEETNRKWTARVYAILEQPGPGEMTTQATETLTGEYDAADKPVEQAELSIKKIVRGVKTDFAPMYSVVKRTPK